MAATTTSGALAALSPEVLKFAAEQGVGDYLPAVLEMTQRIFPDAPLSVFVEGDPEIANDYHIVLEVAVSSTDAEELFAGQQRWTAEIFQRCPSTHVPVFRLGMVAAP